MFTAQNVKELRDKTGAGMMDCKKALEASNGNMEDAITWLREKGIAKAQKKAERIAAEGLTEAFVSSDTAVVLEVNCETDFVAKNEEFKNLIKSIGETLLDSEVSDLEDANNVTLKGDSVTIGEAVVNFTAKIGEKISFRRFVRVNKASNEVFGTYSHMGGRITTLVTLEGNNESVAKDIAMHVAAMRPLFLDSASVDEATLSKEREIYKEQAINSGKSAEIAEKMVDGRVKKYYKEVCLVEQPFIKDQDLSVAQYAKNNGCVVKSMVRYEVGEGIEKRSDNFAEEVRNQING